MVGVYKHFLLNKQIESGTYNAGFENISIMDIAKRVNKKIESEIIITESNDPRSYRQNSDKLIKTGFVQRFSVSDAIEELIAKFNNKELEDKEDFYTIKMMKKILSK
tara:strand:- start:289 stop:609 length:321 start_codon:yes stop_codon:yes gene_type:complete